MKTTVIASIVALSIGGIAAPALAAPARAAAAVVATPPGSGTATAAATDQAGERRYCIVDTVTGTRLRTKECRTRADWLKQGFDPLDPK